MKILITGGAGFIGVNLAASYAKEKHTVIILDNLSRYGTESNLKWLKKEYPKTIQFVRCDITKDTAILTKEINQSIDAVYHLAGQVAVTTSVNHPRADFEANALGTFNVLEAVRSAKKPPFLLYSSTNKVYGSLENVSIVKKQNKYIMKNRPDGIDESEPLDFHSPYGCSKGAADQYVRDYARIYGLETVVFRQSCIYGPHQFGIEDQGWVAWFIIALLTGKKITIYGNGLQVRDILYIDDLINAYKIAYQKRRDIRGEIFNIGGGKDCSISIWNDLQPILQEELGRPINVSYADWRPGDQKIYVSNISKAGKMLGWHPHISPKEGIRKLYIWVSKNIHLYT